MQNGKRDFEQNHVIYEEPKRDIRNGLDGNFIANAATRFALKFNEC